MALGFFALVVFGASVIALLALRSLSALQSVGERLNDSLEDLNAKTLELEEKSERASRRIEEVQPHFDHLRQTMERFSVLTWALGDVLKTVGEMRSAFLVRK
jgi:predicted nuclease with TOPRIM domain